MYSTAQMNGQHQQVGLPFSRSLQAASLLTQNTMWNQQNGEANTSCQYSAANMGVPSSQTKSSFTFQDGAHCNRKMSNWQTPAAPYQPASLHQSSTENDKFRNILFSNCQNSTNIQSGNPSLQVTQHHVYLNSAQNPKTSVMFTSPTQNRAAYWNQLASDQRKQSMRTQDGKNGKKSNFHPHRALKRLNPKPYPAHVTTATSLQHGHTVYTKTHNTASSAAYVSQSVHNQNHRPVTQHGFCSSTSPPSHSATIPHLKNKGTTAYSSLSGQIWHSSRTQQYLLLHNSQNGHLKDPAADAQHQTHSYKVAQEIARIEDSLRESYTTGPDDGRPVHTTSPRKGEHLAENRVKESNQSVWPVTADANGCNPNITQSAMPLYVYHTLHLPQQSTEKDVACVPTPGVSSDNVHRAGSASLPQNGSPPKGSSNNQFLLMLMNVSPSCQGNQMQSSAANNGEKLEMHSSVTWTDIHSSPGCTGTKAVAVVQPLSQESSQGTSKYTSSNTTSQPDVCTPTDTFFSNPQKLSSSSDGAKIGHSASSSDGYVLAMQEDPCVPWAAQKSVTSEVPESQTGNTDKTEISPDPKAHVFDLSSVQTTPWTYNSLMKLIEEGEKSQVALEDNDSLYKIFNMFWDGEIKKLSNKLKSGWYRKLILSLKEFCRNYSTPDTVILSQVTQSPEKQPESYHVLKDNETYSELPYRSSWLNVNKQLDDIDKEFGYPKSWMYCLNKLKSVCQPDQVGTVDSTPVQIASDVPNKVFPQTEVESVASGEEKQASPAEAISPKTSSPCKTESDDSSDPYYSFQIQVLPPEEAKMVFLQSKVPQSTDVDSQPKEVMNSSAEAELPNVRGAALSDLSVICCIEKWLEKFDGSKSKCKCNGEQSDKDCAEMEAATAPKNDILSVIRSDSKSPSPILGQVQQENIDIPVETCGGADLCNDVRPTIDLNENGEKPDSQNISHISINDSSSSIILLSDSEDENQPSSETPTQISDSGDLTLDPDKRCSQDHLKSVGSALSNSSDDGMKEIQMNSSSEAVSHMLVHEEDSAQAQLTCTDSSMEVEEQTEVGVTDAPQRQTEISVTQKHESVQLKRKTRNTTDQIFPVRKNAKKSRRSADMNTQTVYKDAKFQKDFVDAAHGEPSASKRTVELALFGSVRQSKCISTGNLKSHITSSESWSSAGKRAPGVLKVILSPVKRKPSIPPSEPSVKQAIYEKWWRSYPLAKIKHRRKLTTKNSTSASPSAGNPKKAETAAPVTVNKELPSASERRSCNGSTKRHSSRKRSLSNRLKHGEGKTKKHDLTLNQGRSDAERGSRAVKPVLQNNVLRFSVLPNTFNFVDGSSERKETTDHLSRDSDFVAQKGKSIHTTVSKTKGTWCSPPKEKFRPRRTASDQKSSIVFQEFQRRYRKMVQPSKFK